MENEYYEAIEVCPFCMNENTYPMWDVAVSGFKAVCQHCGEEIMLCDECQHTEDEDGDVCNCDWCKTEHGGKCCRGFTTAKAVKERLEKDPFDIYMPDCITIAEMEKYGYRHIPENRMLPISAPVALELYRLEAEVYRLYSDDTEGLVENETEIIEHNGLFGIEMKSWQSVRRYAMTNLFRRLSSTMPEQPDNTTEFSSR